MLVHQRVAMFFITISWSYHGHIGHIRVTMCYNLLYGDYHCSQNGSKKTCALFSNAGYQQWLTRFGQVSDERNVSGCLKPPTSEVFFPPLCCIKTCSVRRTTAAVWFSTYPFVRLLNVLFPPVWMHRHGEDRNLIIGGLAKGMEIWVGLDSPGYVCIYVHIYII